MSATLMCPKVGEWLKSPCWAGDLNQGIERYEHIKECHEHK